MDQRFELPPCDLPDLSHESNPEVAADYVRQHWGIGQQPVKNMVHLLESRGVRVFSISVDVREVDALSTWKGGTPYVFLNGYKSAEHSRFDAAHELCHLVMHKHGAPSGRQAESEANKFASAFLMPKGSVMANAPHFPTIPELRRLKQFWRVSVAALNTRLHQLDLVSEWHYTRLCIEISKRGYRTSEPDSIPRETSQVLPKLFANLYEEDGMTRSRVAAELGLSLTELESLLFSLTMTSMKGGRATAKKPRKPASLSRVK
jgi:Zn-dependent peptidase ImmA (M78 family)